MDRLFESDVSATPPSLPAPGAAGYPQNGGASASPTVPGAYWFHMITESLRHVITAAELTPDASDLTLLAQAIAAMVGGGAMPTGTIIAHRRTAAPAGWVAMDGGTIGNAASGASTRANADTAALFALIWETDNTIAPIYDSAGVATVRGASAAADFNAGKRLSLDDMRGEFIRGLDAGRGIDVGRVLGSAQSGDGGSHFHGIGAMKAASGSQADDASFVTRAWSDGNSYAARRVTGDEQQRLTDTVTGAEDGALGTSNEITAPGGEPHPRNRAYLVCIKL